jgi:hypothetical protein
MASAMRAPHEEHGESVLGPAWRRFLASKESAEFARPLRFVEGLGQWLGQAPARASPAAAHSTVGSRTLAAAEEFIRSSKAREGG